MLAGITYVTFPEIQIGPLTIRTFGLMVGIGVLVGAYFAARYLERFGQDRETSYRLATRMVVWGVIGSRVTWVLTHLDSIESPIDVVAVWEGGLQFSGGFIAAIIAAYPTARHWPRPRLLRNLDGYAYGLTLGLAIGRIGCYSVGEHFGRVTSFLGGTTYEGGDVREPFLGDTLLREGMTFHNTSLYELVHLLVLFGIMTWMVVRHGWRTSLGRLTGLFLLWYGIGRFTTDTFRVNDERFLSLTGAQWMAFVLVPLGAYLLIKSKNRPTEAEERLGPEAAPQSETATT